MNLMLAVAIKFYIIQAFISLIFAAGIMVLFRYGYGPGLRWVKKQEDYYERVLCRQLLLDISPTLAVTIHLIFMSTLMFIGAAIGGLFLGGLFLVIASFIPYFLIRHLEYKRRQKLEVQLVDGLAALASGVRAGLNLVQAIELLVHNQRGPIQQEFGQILREYAMGMDLNQAMRSASNRIGSSLYRLTFTAIEMHRVRGGDSGESMDRIAASVREIQKLEGKLDAITAQGRAQANFMAVTPFVILFLLWGMMPEETEMLFTQNVGRIILLIAIGLIVGGYVWIKKIMRVDI